MNVPITPADTYRDVLDFERKWTRDLPPAVALKMVLSYCKMLSEPDRYERMSEADVAAYKDLIQS